ncbi:MAG: hypothetical protein KAH04_07800, partial [Psychrilyobacter sp.]|nr:hypothetical protein [Psychrilyobacter sp.]
MKNLFFIIITLTIQYVLFKEIFISKYLEYNFFIFEDLLNSLFAIYVLFAVKNGLYSRSRLPLWGMLRKHFILSVEYIGIVMIIL